MSSSSHENATARLVITLCFVWMLLLPLIGGSGKGKAWLGSLATNVFVHDVKGGVIMMMVAIPLLSAGTIASLLAVQVPPPSTTSTATTRATTFRTVVTGTINSYCPIPIQRLYQSTFGWIGRRDGDFPFNMVAFLFLFLPSIIYVTSNMYLKIYGQDLTPTKRMDKIGKAFGMMAIIATSFLLVPVSRQNPIWNALQWKSIPAVQLHIWSGRIVVIGVFLHGMFYFVKWIQFDNSNLWDKLLPPPGCWSLQDTSGKCDGCDCYELVRNFTGLLAFLAMLVMGVTSLYWVRRRHYSLFYKVHVLCAPIAIFMSTLHYNRAILYLAPGLLYYVANSFPVLIESSRFVGRKGTEDNSSCPSCDKQSDAMKIVSVTHIADGNDTSDNQNSSNSMIPMAHQQSRPCVSITLEASTLAWKQYRPGMHVNIHVPQISNVSHPFTINKVIESSSNSQNKDQKQKKYLRIIFRVVGPFTKQLATYLTSSTRDRTTLPKIYFHGFHGSPNRVRQVLQHDAVMLIAAGVGITPFLSLLEELTSIMIEVDDTRNEQVLQTSVPVFSNKKIVLHWMCRDAALVDYIRQEYFEPLLQLSSPSSNKNSDRHCIQLVVHQTGDEIASSKSNKETNRFGSRPMSSYSDYPDDIKPYVKMGEKTGRTSEQWSDLIRDGDDDGFTPSRFSQTLTITGNVGRFVTLATVAWVGLWIIWWLYFNMQHKKEVHQRAYAPMAIFLVGMIVASVVNIVPRRFYVSEDVPLVGSPGSSRKHEGKWWDHVIEDEDHTDDSSPLQEDADELLSSSSIEMASLKKGSITGNDEKSKPVDKEMTLQLVTLQLSKGRPALDELVQSIDNAESPAVICCTPPELANSVFNCTRTKCQIGCPKIAYYNEAFEI